MNDKSEMLIINKYGAVNVEEIIRLQKRVRILEKIIEDMAGIKRLSKELSSSETITYAHEVSIKIRKLTKDIPKMVELTKCNNYKFVTTTETKLIKKKEDK